MYKIHFQHSISTKGIKIVHVNIRSLYKKLDQIALLYKDIDFLLLTETWLNEKYTDGILSIPGMTLYRNDRCNAAEHLLENGNIPRRGGGVAIYIRNSWKPFVSIFEPGTIITEDVETLSIKIDKPGNRKLFISVVYKPPKGKIENCLSHLEGLFYNIDIRRREKWVLGDFNVDLGNRNTPETLLVNRFLKDNSLKQLIHEHTRLSNRGGSCIDWIITDCSYVKASGLLDELLSDHFSIYVVRKKEREHVCKKWKKIRVTKNYDKDVLTTLLNEYDWTAFFTLHDVDVMWDIMLSRVISILEIMCPYKNVYLRDPKTPWITAEIIGCINDRKKYLRLYRKTKNQFIFEICKYLRNECNRLIRNAKSAYIKDNLQRSADDPRKFWKNINNLLKGPKEENIAHEFIDSTGANVAQGEVCDFLNNYFVSIGMSNAVNVHLKSEWNLEDPGYTFKTVTLKETSDLVKDIDIGKDSCVEGVSTLVLKECFSALVRQLQYLFNTSLNVCTFPRKWAKGFINILPKGGNLKDPSNWRPITQTPLPAKMLEKVVQKRIFSILRELDYVSEFQYGFMPGRSTQLAIFDILKQIYEAKNSKLTTGLLFLDVRKAFDSLDHNLLLNKLQELGIGGKMLSWFDSYLDRTQRVRHNGRMSTEVKFRCGIPQGSCLGPTLFIFYINDVFRHVNDDIQMMMFADDCVLYKSHVCANIVLEYLQIGLNEYVDWGRNNNMFLNAGKTKSMMVFPTIHQNLYRPIVTDNKFVHFVKTFNYLGVILDDQLSFTTYYNYVKRRIENKIFVLSKLRKYIDCKTAILIYKQAILPLAEYAGFVLTSCSIGQRHELQVLQNNALRLCKRYYLRDRIRIDNLHAECSIIGLE